MANANTPRGLVPYKYTSGAPYNGSANIYYVPSDYATALYLGQPLIATGSSDANGIPVVATATAGTSNYIIGPMVGIVDGGNPVVAVTQGQPVYHPASTAQYILVADDPTLLYMVQDNGGTQATAPNLWAGKNANLVSGSGSTVTGYSGWQLSAASVAGTTTLDVKIMRPLPEVDNIVSNVANTNMNAKWLVKLNNYRYANQIAGV